MENTQVGFTSKYVLVNCVLSFKTIDVLSETSELDFRPNVLNFEKLERFLNFQSVYYNPVSSPSLSLSVSLPLLTDRRRVERYAAGLFFKSLCQNDVIIMIIKFINK